jgi:hypothetical protein
MQDLTFIFIKQNGNTILISTSTELKKIIIDYVKIKLKHLTNISFY